MSSASSSSWSGHGSVLASTPGSSQAGDQSSVSGQGAESLEATKRTRLRMARAESRWSDEKMGQVEIGVAGCEVDLRRGDTQVTKVCAESLHPSAWPSKTSGVWRMPLSWDVAAVLWTCPLVCLAIC